MEIEHALAEWDGKETESMEALHQRYGENEVYVEELVRLAEHPFSQKGSTWLLKRHLESGGSIAPEHVGRLIELMPTYERWETQLHILQSLQYVTIAAEHKEQVETFVRTCLSSKKTFVRTWAYNAFHLLAKTYPEYQSEVDALFAKAMNEESASVKARIRNILKDKNKS